MKVNAQVFRTASRLHQAGICVFAGFPKIGSLVDLSEDPQFLWYSIDNQEHPSDIEISVERATDIGPRHFLEGPLSEGEVCSRVLRDSNLMPWPKVVEAIDHVRRGEDEFLESSFQRAYIQRVYKPIYVIAW
jgi:hypothetical protein